MVELKNIKVFYKGVCALNNINLKIEKGIKLGVVGQSGSGKTTLCKILSGIEKNFEGEIIWNYKNNKIQFVFQDPVSSLNPRMKIFDIVTEAAVLNGIKDKHKLFNIFKNVINEVGLSVEVGDKYPHQLSGGQRQRVAIARSIIINPDLIIFDEPISSLDVSLASQILNLIYELHNKYRFTLIFVSHDISSIYYLTDNVVVLLNGEIVEEGPTSKVIEKPVHPYTRLLISSVLFTDKKYSSYILPEKKLVRSLCPFVSRCFYAEDICEKYSGDFFDISYNHRVKCLRYRDL
ncbi:MAG: ABC transporter ATP-binding protein [Elusimicrobiales bacterium]|nr:ABC transporter ATP-binding protein [Elusimicrobiales bacterium]